MSWLIGYALMPTPWEVRRTEPMTVQRLPIVTLPALQLSYYEKRPPKLLESLAKRIRSGTQPFHHLLSD